MGDSLLKIELVDPVESANPLFKVKQIEAAYTFTCALFESRQVKCFGSNGCVTKFSRMLVGLNVV